MTVDHFAGQINGPSSIIKSRLGLKYSTMQGHKVVSAYFKSKQIMTSGLQITMLIILIIPTDAYVQCMWIQIFHISRLNNFGQFF